MLIRLGTTLLAVAISSAVVNAQLQAQDILETPKGTLEVIGLRRYTLQGLQDSLAKYAPGQSLQSHACAVYLREKLHFPAAAVNVRADAAGKRTFIVTIVEPGDSAHVSEVKIGSGRSHAELWPDIRSAGMINGKFDASDFSEKVQFYGMVGKFGLDSAVAVMKQIYDEEEFGRASAILRAIKARSTTGDRSLALEVIGTDPDGQNRAMASAVLMNFPSDPAAWRALVGAMRDMESGPREAARLALRVMTINSPQKIDWAPATTDLRFLLGGTNAWVYTDIMAALVATGVSPDLAKPLLRDNWHLLVAHARAQNAAFKDPATRLLSILSGMQAGTPEKWETWAKGLSK